MRESIFMHADQQDVAPLDQLEDILIGIKNNHCSFHSFGDTRIDSLFQDFFCPVVSILLERINSRTDRGAVQREKDYIEKLLAILQNRLKERS